MFLVSLCTCVVCMIFLLLRQKTAYQMRCSDWSSDVCSSDLVLRRAGRIVPGEVVARRRDRLSGRGVAVILLAERVRVVFDVVEHMQRAMRRIVQRSAESRVGKG